MTYLITYTTETGRTFDAEKMTLDAAESFASLILDCKVEGEAVVSSEVSEFDYAFHGKQG